MTGPRVGERISEYVLDALIGASRFGQVWKARHHVWQNDLVAIKIPTDPRLVQQLQKEGLAVHGLSHPNIVRAIGLDPFADIPYLVMEYVDGLSLDKLIERYPQGLPIGSARVILTGLLTALEHAHAAGVVHHDIKPSNVLIAGAHRKAVESIATEDVKVTDFGLDRTGEIAALGALQSGILSYIAPELRDGEGADARSDLYSVGVVLFEMVSGQRPGGGEMPSQVRPGQVSWVDALYARLYTRRERRMGSAAEAIRMIDTMSLPPVIAGTTANKMMPPPPPPPGSARHPTRSCPSCGQAVEIDDNFCILCGAQVAGNVRQCMSCGGIPEADDLYCVLCGSPLPAEMG